MSLISPDLDDRGFDQLVAEARDYIGRSCPEWNDLSASDPGIILLEVYAHLTETMIYRLNRLPDKNFVAFLNLLGARLRPPSLARVKLTFSRADAQLPCEIPQGIAVQSIFSRDANEAPIFTTNERLLLGSGETSASVYAYHGNHIKGETLGYGNAMPGQSFKVAHAPISIIPGDDTSVIIAVECSSSESESQYSVINWQGRPFRIWQEVSDFSNLEGHPCVFKLDRFKGTVSFAHAVIDEIGAENLPADVPGNGLEVCIWYWHGGGARGNLPAGTLTILKDQIPGIDVTNEEAASGGLEAETLDNALLRGPLEFKTLDRAVTAGDYEILAQQGCVAIGRAKAYTQAEMWSHATAGMVEVLLVPNIPAEDRENERMSIAKLTSLQTDDALDSVKTYLKPRQVIGARCDFKWTRYKEFMVKARIIIRQAEVVSEVYERILKRVNLSVQPLPNSVTPKGWDYGAPLHVSSIYSILQSEPGVCYVEDVALLIDDAPDERVHALEVAPFQEGSWYAGEDEKLFHSVNNGEGWEIDWRFDNGEKIRHVLVNKHCAGIIAIICEKPLLDEQNNPLPSEWSILLSRDCGESWNLISTLQFQVRGCAWLPGSTAQHLLLATDNGLLQLEARLGAVPLTVLVNPQEPMLKLWAVAATFDETGRCIIAVSAQDQKGLYISRRGAETGAFEFAGLAQEDVRILKFQPVAVNLYLWAGLSTFGMREGDGCCRLNVLQDWSNGANWEKFKEGWSGGSCYGLACVGSRIFAATHHAGVLEISTSSHDKSWQHPGISSGLSMRDVSRFNPIYAVAASVAQDGSLLMMASSSDGVYKRDSDNMEYTYQSQCQFRDRMTLPPTWLFCPGEHQIEVLKENEI